MRMFGQTALQAGRCQECSTDRPVFVSELEGYSNVTVSFRLCRPCFNKLVAHFDWAKETAKT